MKIKKPAIMGTLSRKIAKYLIKEYQKEEGKISLKKDEMKCQILENIKVIMEQAKS